MFSFCLFFFFSSLSLSLPRCLDLSQEVFVYCAGGVVAQGLMQCMVTVTHMNDVPEIRAAVRGGAFARRTEEDKISYLLTRTRKDDSPLRCADHPVEHVLSYQHRMLAFKKEFLTRGKQSPLGLPTDLADRTEACSPIAYAEARISDVRFSRCIGHACVAYVYPDAHVGVVHMFLFRLSSADLCTVTSLCGSSP